MNDRPSRPQLTSALLDAVRIQRDGLRRSIVQGLDRLSALTMGWRVWGLALLIANLPFLLAWAIGFPDYHVISGALLPLVVLPLAWRRRHALAMAVLAVAFLAHCVQTMLLTWLDPAGVMAISPAFGDYLARQEHWISTGVDPEYALGNWLPAHLRLVLAAVITAPATLGGLIYIQGFFEVDLMNHYTACLMGRSLDPLSTMLWAWHAWSVLRGIGFLLVTYAGATLALGWLTDRTLLRGRVAAGLLGLGLGFLAADAVVKLLLLPATRLHLAGLLGPPI